MYSIDIFESAQKEFKKRGSADQQRVLGVLERIRIKPRSYSLSLSGSRAYRVRAGKLRIVVDIFEEKQKIVVLKIGNRESVYQS